MRDLPIIFSGPMVRALLDGRKTMTRRLIKLPTKGEYVRADMGGWAPTTVGGGSCFRLRRDGTREPAPELVAIWNRTTGTCIAARYQIGDRLWVRETWCPVNDTEFGGKKWIDYRATPSDSASHPAGWDNEPDHPDALKWRSPIHCPRTASRLTLLVTAVKIERLYDISDDDIRAEGVTETDTSWLNAWRQLWESINGPDHWETNPFVVAATFAVRNENIDRLVPAAA